MAERTETSNFDIADYLDEPELITNFLNEVLSNGDAKDLIAAMGYVAKAMGMTTIAQKTGMSRTSLYKALQPNARPQFDTVFKVLKAFGGGIEIKAVPPIG